MRRILLLAFAQLWVLAALTPPAVVGLSLLVQRWAGPEDAPALLGVALACGSAAALVCNPLFGRWVDRTPRRLGGRRVWLVLGAAGGLAGSVCVALAADPVALILSWVLTQGAYNACFAAVNGMLSSELEANDRTRAAGALTAVSFLGTLPGLLVTGLLASDVVLMTTLLPAVALVLTSAVALIVRDAGGTRRREAQHGRDLRALRSRPFLVAFGVRFALGAELAGGLIYGLYLFQERWSLPTADAVRWVALTTFSGALGLVAAAAVLALLGRRRGLEPVLLRWALVGTAIGMVARGLAPSPELFLAASVVAGASIGVGSTATRSLVQGMLPPERSAFGLGVFNVASTGSVIVAPLLASALLAAGALLPLADRYAGYYLLFAAPLLLLLLAVRRSTLGARDRAPRDDAPVDAEPAAR